MTFKLVRLFLPLGWILAAIGYYGPWIAHKTAALTLTGSDMAEFVKFLPGVLDGSMHVARQLFYLPPVAVALSVALLAGSRLLSYPSLLRVAVLLLSAVISAQLLPPAWSLASLMTTEFRLQPIALGICLLALALFWFWGRLPIRVTSPASFCLCALAAVLPAWQFLVAKPAIDAVYGTLVAVGWGYVVCLAGLGVLAGANAVLVLSPRNFGRNALT